MRHIVVREWASDPSVLKLPIGPPLSVRRADRELRIKLG